MEHSSMEPFEKYPQQVGMDKIQRAAYLFQVRRFMDEIDGLPLPALFLRIQDFVLGNAAWACHHRGDVWHIESWVWKELGEKAYQVRCEQRRDEAVACRDAVRELMHVPYQPAGSFLLRRDDEPDIE
jgi:hypothetical protein